MSILKFWKLVFCFAWAPLYIGSGSGPKLGGDKSQQTNSTVQNYDQRQVITNSLDGGAIGLAQQVATEAIKNTAHAYDYSENIFSAAVDFANKNDSRAFNAFDRAAQVTGDALVGIKAAYADSKGTTDSQKQIIFGVLGVAAVMAVAMLRARG